MNIKNYKNYKKTQNYKITAELILQRLKNIDIIGQLDFFWKFIP